MKYHHGLPCLSFVGLTGALGEPPLRDGVPDYLGLEGLLCRFPQNTRLQKSLGVCGKSSVPSGSREGMMTEKHKSKFSGDRSVLCNDLEVVKSACICKESQGANNLTLPVSPGCEHP